MMIPSTFFESPPVLSEPFKPSKLRALFRRTVYFGVRRRSIFAWCYETNRLHRDVPTAAVTKDGKTWRFGEEALPFGESNSVIRLEIFSHPRVAVEEIEAAAKLLRHFSEKVMKPVSIFAGRTVILHYLEDLEGGLASCERRELIRGCVEAGFKEVFLLAPENRISELDVIELCRDLGAFRGSFEGFDRIVRASLDKERHLFPRNE